LRQTIHHFCPDLPARLELIVDPRERREYSMTEILMGAIFLYILKTNNLSEKSIPPKIFRLVGFPHCPVRDLFHVQLVFAWAVLQTLSGLSGVAPRYM